MAMERWRRVGWVCAAILSCAEYSWLATIDKVVPPVPQFLSPVQALLFPATVLAMVGAAAFLAALIYALARRQPTSAADFVALAICVASGILILRW